MNLDRRMDKIEVKSARSIEALVTEERRKKAEALEEWRIHNYTRILWDLFMLIEGPKLEHPDDYKKENGGDDEFIDSYLAYFAMLDRIFEHGHDEDGFLDMSKMSTDEKAFAVCLQHYFDHIDEGWLLDRGIQAQAIALGIGLALHKGEISVADAVQCIDDHRGGPEWRQLCMKNLDQLELDASKGIPTITEIPTPGLPWADPGRWP